jgi:hypothetical protein
MENPLGKTYNELNTNQMTKHRKTLHNSPKFHEKSYGALIWFEKSSSVLLTFDNVGQSDGRCIYPFCMHIVTIVTTVTACVQGIVRKSQQKDPRRRQS